MSEPEHLEFHTFSYKEGIWKIHPLKGYSCLYLCVERSNKFGSSIGGQPKISERRKSLICRLPKAFVKAKSMWAEAFVAPCISPGFVLMSIPCQLLSGCSWSRIVIPIVFSPHHAEAESWHDNCYSRLCLLCFGVSREMRNLTLFQHCRRSWYRCGSKGPLKLGRISAGIL